MERAEGPLSSMSSHADVRLHFAHDPSTDELVVAMRLPSDDVRDPPREMRLATAQRRALARWSERLRQGGSNDHALRGLAIAVEKAFVRSERRGPAPLEPLLLLTAPEAGVALPARRVIVEGAEAGAILLEACGAAGHWPGLTDHWQWVHHLPPAEGRVGEAVVVPDSTRIRALCVIGSHEGAGHLTNDRHDALQVLRGLRASSLDLRFVIAASERDALLAAAGSSGLDDVVHWLRSSPPNLAIATDVGPLAEEIAKGRELLLWLGHSDADPRDAAPASALLLAGTPESAPSAQRLTFVRLAGLLRDKPTRLCALMACRVEPGVAARLLEAVDHVVITEGFVPTGDAAGFAGKLLDCLAHLDPVSEAVRIARTSFAPVHRWQVQYWTRTLDPRPFVDRKARAVAVYLTKTPHRPAEEESAVFAPGPDWHATRAIELAVGSDSMPSLHDRRGLVGEWIWWGGRPISSPTLRSLLTRNPAGDSTRAGRWLVLGEPGSGKSTMLQRERVLLALEANRPFVPVFVKLAHWARDKRRLRTGRDRFEIEDYVEKRFEMGGSGLAEGLIERARLGEVCYLLDGLDEVPDRKGCDESVTELLTKLAEERPLCPIVVTSRPIEARNYVLGAYTRCEVRPLSRERQIELLTLRYEGDRNRAGALLDGLADNPTVQELARNPLFLTIFAMTSGKGSRKDLRPHDVLDACITELLEGRHRKKPIAWPAAASLNKRLSVLVYLAFAATQKLSDEVDDDALRDSFAALGGDLGALLKCLHQTGLIRPAPSDGLVTTGWSFAHRQLAEALVSRELAARWAKGGGDRASVGELARALRGGDGEERERRLHFWAEPFALMAGRVGEHGPDAIVQTLIDDQATRPIGLRALINAHRLSPDTIAATFGKLEDWEDRRRVIEGLLERVPQDQVVPLLARLGRSTSEGNDLFFLWLQLERLEVLGGARGAQACAARKQLFDHLEPREDEMRGAFSHVPGRPGHRAFCRIAPGVFDMGDDIVGWERDVAIEHEFWIGATAVTVGQYRLFDPRHRCTVARELRPVTVEGKSEQQARDRYPVVDVTWYACVSFARWLSRWQHLLPRENLNQGDLAATLPSEAQWEYAARAGGPPGQRFWFGNDDKALAAHSRTASAENAPFPVATASESETPPPSPCGLFDVHGGVWEWCANEYDGDRRAERIGISASASSRVLRGGSILNDPGSCRSAFRSFFPPAFSYRLFGFRVVLAVRSPGSE